MYALGCWLVLPEISSSVCLCVVHLFVKKNQRHEGFHPALKLACEYGGEVVVVVVVIVILSFSVGCVCSSGEF